MFFNFLSISHKQEVESKLYEQAGCKLVAEKTVFNSSGMCPGTWEHA
jgi:hypothetical protein